MPELGRIIVFPRHRLGILGGSGRPEVEGVAWLRPERSSEICATTLLRSRPAEFLARSRNASQEGRGGRASSRGAASPKWRPARSLGVRRRRWRRSIYSRREEMRGRPAGCSRRRSRGQRRARRRPRSLTVIGGGGAEPCVVRVLKPAAAGGRGRGRRAGAAAAREGPTGWRRRQAGQNALRRRGGRSWVASCFQLIASARRASPTAATCGSLSTQREGVRREPDGQVRGEALGLGAGASSSSTTASVRRRRRAAPAVDGGLGSGRCCWRRAAARRRDGHRRPRLALLRRLTGWLPQAVPISPSEDAAWALCAAKLAAGVDGDDRRLLPRPAPTPRPPSPTSASPRPPPRAQAATVPEASSPTARARPASAPPTSSASTAKCCGAGSTATPARTLGRRRSPPPSAGSGGGGCASALPTPPHDWLHQA